MHLSDIGEEALLDHVFDKFRLPKSGPGLVVGVGDDAAVLDLGSGKLTIVTTDMLIEGPHFRLDLITPYHLGWKSVAANISDIAAMGGLPTWTFASIGLKPDMDLEFADSLFEGMTECAEKFLSKIVGGDTNAVEANTVISVTQLGEVEKDRLALRSGARIGDRILVTGWLGNSIAGLHLLLKLGLDEAARQFGWLVDAHLMPMPRVWEARAAVETGGVHAMMDLSDGLGRDLPKLCKASGVGALVYADKLPVSDDLCRAAEVLGADPIDLAAGGGEDFELLMAVAPGDVGRVTQAVKETGTTVTEIGEIVEGPVEIAYPDGSRKPLEGGWEHFK
jgi:thiamine-monophosphate kinase